MKRKTKFLFQNASRELRRELHELDRHPQERRVHFAVENLDPRIDAVGRAYINAQPIERHRAEKAKPVIVYPDQPHLRREAVSKPYAAQRRRVGKTAKDKRTGAWAARLANLAARAAA